ncbi:hypothetical protein BDV06DRAFT_181608 [Aspergillus oleicola]
MYFTKVLSVTTLFAALVATAPAPVRREEPTAITQLKSLSQNLKNFCGASNATTTTFQGLWDEATSTFFGPAAGDLDTIFAGFTDANDQLQSACATVTSVLDEATSSYQVVDEDTAASLDGVDA